VGDGAGLSSDGLRSVVCLVQRQGGFPNGVEATSVCVEPRSAFNARQVQDGLADAGAPPDMWIGEEHITESCVTRALGVEADDGNRIRAHEQLRVEPAVRHHAHGEDRVHRVYGDQGLHYSAYAGGPRRLGQGYSVDTNLGCWDGA
jgi:hypothetical protein